MKRALLTITVVILAVLFADAQDSSVPELINYQGKLTDVNGNPLEGMHKLEFNIWNQASLGTKLWGPQTFTAVQVIQGHFNVILGPTDNSGTPIVGAFAGSERYLQILVWTGDGYSEISPRQRILSAPYAIRAEHAMKADLAAKVESLSGGHATFNSWVSEPFSNDYVWLPGTEDDRRMLTDKGSGKKASITIIPTGHCVVIGLRPVVTTDPEVYSRIRAFNSWMHTAYWNLTIGTLDDAGENLETALGRIALQELATSENCVVPISSIQTTVFHLTPGQQYKVGVFLERVSALGLIIPQVFIENCQLYAYEVGGQAQ